MATADLIERLPELERQAEQYEVKARALRQIIEGVRALNGEAIYLLGIEEAGRGTNQYATGDGPRGRNAVRLIVADRPGEWQLKEIKQVNRERGWPSSPAAIETAVKRMEAAGEAIRVRFGTYRFGEPERAHDEAVTPTDLHRKEGDAC